MLRLLCTSDPAETNGFHRNILALGAETSTEHFLGASFTSHFYMANDLLQFRYIAGHCQMPDIHNLHLIAYCLPACLITYLMTCLQVLPSHRRMAAAAYDVHESIQPCRQVLMAWRTSLFQVDCAAHQKSWFLSSHVAFPDDPSTTCHITSKSRVYMLRIQRKQQCVLNIAWPKLRTTCRAV